MRHDPINDAICHIKHCEKLGKEECVLSSTSKLLVEILAVFQKEGYVGEFEIEENPQGGKIKVKLIKRINECGVIKPRFPVKHAEYPKWEKRFLPSRDFGLLVVSTSKGVMSHKEAKEKGEGGRLLAYAY